MSQHDHAPRPEINVREPVPQIVRRHIGEHASYGAGIAPLREQQDMRPVAAPNHKGQSSNVDPMYLVKGMMEATTNSMPLPSAESITPTASTAPSWLNELPYGEDRPRGPLTVEQIKQKLGNQTPTNNPNDFRNPDGSFNHAAYRRKNH